MRQITVNAAGNSYAVLCGPGLLARVGDAAGALGTHSSVFVLTSPRIWKLWGRELGKSFAASGGCQAILFDDRERSKTLATVEKLCRQLIRAGADRQSLIVALGGGVVGDVAGFVAASYMRGVLLIQVPTTLVGQVDSAIGGKTGVNLREVKNLVGAFYHPSLVVADPGVLRTLTAREYRSGLYEVIKYGVIGDVELFSFLEARLPALLKQQHEALDWVIPRCIEAKAEVVHADERERGRREILNFGHTVGHALESLTGYKRFLHGEAVGWGMLAASRLAVEAGHLPAEDAARIARLIRAVGPLPKLPALTAARLMEAMHRDKKSRGGALRFVLPRRIGDVQIGVQFAEPTLRKVLSGWLAAKEHR